MIFFKYLVLLLHMFSLCSVLHLKILSRFPLFFISIIHNFAQNESFAILVLPLSLQGFMLQILNLNSISSHPSNFIQVFFI